MPLRIPSGIWTILPLFVDPGGPQNGLFLVILWIIFGSFLLTCFELILIRPEVFCKTLQTILFGVKALLLGQRINKNIRKNVKCQKATFLDKKVVQKCIKKCHKNNPQKMIKMNTQNTRFGVGSSIQLLSDSYFGIFLDRTSFTDQSSMFQKLLKMAQIYGGAIAPAMS